MPKSITIFGFHSIQTQLENYPENIIKAFSLKDRADKRLLAIDKQLNDLNLKIEKCSKKHLDKITKNNSHQGIAALILLPSLLGQNELTAYINKIKTTSLILVLDSIQDPRNLGACLRNASAANVDCVIINKNQSANINSLAYKTSAGAVNQLKIFQVTNIAQTIKELKNKNIWTIGLDLSANKSLYSIDLKLSTAIIIGSEGKGLRSLNKKMCDELAIIPIKGNIQSLNVAVATGISLFEVNRQRNLFDKAIF
jgi:23S rRNA (guanosine2251-2'-O)-methyltransferase